MHFKDHLLYPKQDCPYSLPHCLSNFCSPQKDLTTIFTLAHGFSEVFLSSTQPAIASHCFRQLTSQSNPLLHENLAMAMAMAMAMANQYLQFQLIRISIQVARDSSSNARLDLTQIHSSVFQWIVFIAQAFLYK